AAWKTPATPTDTSAVPATSSSGSTSRSSPGRGAQATPWGASACRGWRRRARSTSLVAPAARRHVRRCRFPADERADMYPTDKEHEVLWNRAVGRPVEDRLLGLEKR